MDDRRPRPRETFTRLGWGAGLAIGMGVGVAIGSAMHNMAVGIAIGMGVGVALMGTSTVIGGKVEQGWRDAEKKAQDDQPDDDQR